MLNSARMRACPPVRFGGLQHVGSAALAAASTFTLVVSTTFFEALTSSRMLVVLVALMLWHVLTCPRMIVTREAVLYAVFVAYLLLSLLWTPDPVLALNTLFPAVDFLLILILFGSLIAFHDLYAVLWGALIGFLAAATMYTSVSGFPFSVPEDFSYNAIAGVYLFGLLIVLVFGWARRLFVLPALGILVLLVHVAATTSIKTNLGIVLGAAVAGLVFFRSSMRTLRHHLLLLLLAVALMAYVIASSESFMERLEYSATRVSIGLEVLQAREDKEGYAGFDERRFWLQEGVAAWGRNPVFGYGVESFRYAYGITSHSTVVDLLHNSGLIGFALFYCMLGSVALRVVRARKTVDDALRAIVLAGLLCNVFISLSGLLFYQPFLAAYIAIGSGLLIRIGNEQRPCARLAQQRGPVALTHEVR